MYDAISVGAGPAGLSATLWFGRCHCTASICTGKVLGDDGNDATISR
jgi:thioredoxin reductase